MLELVRHDARIRIVSDGVAVVDGLARSDDRIEGRLTTASGATSEVVLGGALTDREFCISGHGAIAVGPLSIEDATVRVAPLGISVSWMVPWPDGRAVGSIEMTDGLAKWRGRLDGQQLLQCLLTKSEMLRTSITFDIEAGATQPFAATLAVLDGRNIEVPLGPSWWTALDPGWSAIRAATLNAVARYLRQELAASAASFVRAQSDDADHDDDRSSDLGDVTNGVANGTTNADPRVAAGSYLARASTAAASKRAALAAAGYIPAARASAPTGGGYIAAVHASAPTAGGYVTASPRVQPSRSAAGAGAGYLPAAPRLAGYLRTATAEHQRRQGMTALGALETKAARGHAPLDLERAGYALLRCKDLLQAVNAATAKEAAGHAG